MYLNIVGIPPSPKRTITEKIDFCNCDENYNEDKYKWEVDYVGKFGTFFDDIADEKDFDDGRENPVSMGG